MRLWLSNRGRIVVVFAFPRTRKWFGQRLKSFFLLFDDGDRRVGAGVVDEHELVA